MLSFRQLQVMIVKIAVYRTIEDLDAIRAASLNAKSGVVIGGGLLGLEAAESLTLI